MDPFHPIQPIEPGLPARVQRVDRDQQRERARDDQHSPSDDPDEQAYEEDFSEAYERSRLAGRADEDRPATGPEAYRTEPPPGHESDWNPRLRRDRRTFGDGDHEDDEDDPGPHIDIIA